MQRNFIWSAMIGVLLLLGASTASAQDPANLGELLAKGAKRLDAAEVKALLTGATSTGLAYNGRSESSTSFSADGKANTKVFGMHPEVNPNLFGSWTVNDQGQSCLELTPVSHHLRPYKGCSWWYVLNNVHYIAASDERGTPVRSRRIER
jgi:hypothetical protein